MREEIKQLLVEFGMALATKCMISNNWDIDMTEFVEEYSKSFPVDKPVKPANDNHAIKYAINELTTLEGLLLEAREMDAKTLNKAISILSQLRNRLHNRLSV